MSDLMGTPASSEAMAVQEWSTAPCLNMTQVLTKVDAFQDDTLSPQHLSPTPPLAIRPVTRVKSQHGPDLIGKKRDYSLKKFHGLELGRKIH